jgi:Autographiviridae tail tubular protein Gp11
VDFNTEKDYSLDPDVDNNIVIPANILTVITDKWDGDFVQRGTKLYDRGDHTFTIERSLKAKVVLLFGFEELPEVARNYIAVRAARIFQDNAEGLADAHTYSQQDELSAWIALQNYEAETGDYRYPTL